MVPRRAFTLIELLVVISIISLLSSIVLASINSARAKAQKAAALRFSAQFNRSLGGDARGIWDFDDNSGTSARDLSRNGSSGAFQGSPAWSSDTVSGTGSSLSFNGSNAYLLGSIPTGTFSGDFTITAWFKRSAQTTWGTVFSNSVGTSDTAIMTMRNNTNQFGIMRVGVTENEGVYIDLGSDMDGKWIFGVVQRQGNVLKVMAYKDGRLISNSGNITWTLLSTNQFYIGRHYSGSTGLLWNGLIDEVSVYSDALSIAKIEELYTKGSQKLIAYER
ncbi:MAG: LamG domain-containing protein [Candidatus Taylorbacteria bacterium]|nr:LamG domain-containing protein [Candidatus Taylorbacteria bacterium]